MASFPHQFDGSKDPADHGTSDKVSSPACGIHEVAQEPFPQTPFDARREGFALMMISKNDVISACKEIGVVHRCGSVTEIL
jgi:hypothetical protein